jgi:hypothetical protein
MKTGQYASLKSGDVINEQTLIYDEIHPSGKVRKLLFVVR